MKNKIRDFILKTIAVIFSILFAIVLFNTIFFNKTIGINYKIPVIIIFTIIVYGIILFLYYIYTKKEMKFLDYSPKKIYNFYSSIYYSKTCIWRIWMGLWRNNKR